MRRYLSSLPITHGSKSAKTLAYSLISTAPSPPSPSSPPSPPAAQHEACFFTHGILGAGRNWTNFARSYLSRVSPAGSPPLSCYLVDLRNHGGSQSPESFPPPQTIQACAEDIKKLTESLGVYPKMVSGHSFGGKVVLRYLTVADVKPKHVWLLDSAVDLGHSAQSGISSVSQVLRSLKQVQMPISSHKELLAQLKDMNCPDAIALWQTTNLVRCQNDRQKLEWVFDLHRIEEMFKEYLSTAMWDDLEEVPDETTVTLVRAEKGVPWPLESWLRFEDVMKRKRNIRTITLKNAAHWLHTDNPQGLLDIMAPPPPSS